MDANHLGYFDFVARPFVNDQFGAIFEPTVSLSQQLSGCDTFPVSLYLSPHHSSKYLKRLRPVRYPVIDEFGIGCCK